MPIVLLALLTCWVVGTWLTRLLLSDQGPGVYGAFHWGIGFAVGSAIAGMAVLGLEGVLGSLYNASIVVLIVLSTQCAVLSWRCRTNAQSPSWRDLVIKMRWENGLTALLLMAIVTHMLLGLLNNLMRPIFPWDAFTTWLYRSKAWVLDDKLSPLMPALEWIANDGASQFAIYAQQYPTLLSVLAAWLAALTGGWHPGAASLPWSFAAIALALSIFGLLRRANLSFLVSLSGAYLCASLPLLNMHAALAGYADIWMALYSGMGLALLLNWRLFQERQYLWLGLLLLVLGTQIKLEGWLCLAIGLTFIAGTALPRIWLALTCAVLLLGLGIALFILGVTTLDLGPLGRWGYDSTHLHVGVFGSFQQRPYNPLGDYLDALFLQVNFSLLFFIYIGSLLLLLIKRPRHFSSHLLMAALIALSQGVIFGLSSFSEYAESGTAITRLIIHFLPVVIYTSAMCLGRLEQAPHSVKHWLEQSQNPFLSAAAVTMSALALAFLLLVVSKGMLTDHEQHVLESQELTAVVGQGRITDEGAWQFSQSDSNLGVLKSTRIPSKEKRFLHLNVSGRDAQHARFYWLEKNNPSGFNLIKISDSGRFVDMEKLTTWNPAEVSEFGYLVESQHFPDTRINGLTFSDGVTGPALIHWLADWAKPVPVTQRTLNNLSLPLLHPFSWPFLLAVVSLALVSACLVLRSISGRGLAVAVTSLGLVWILADVVWLQSYGRATLAEFTEEVSDGGPDDAGHNLRWVAQAVSERLKPDDQVLIIPATPKDDFEAQKMAYLLLPTKAVTTGAARDAVPQHWSGSILLVGRDELRLNRKSRWLRRHVEGVDRLLWSEDFVRLLQ